MGQIAQTFQLNLATLKQCREQMALSLQDVKKKVSSIEIIEQGNKRPTYKQLDMLADLYQVPRWVFIADDLPEEFCFTETPVFRRFADSSVFNNSRVRQLVTKVKHYRDLFIELRQDLGEPIEPFSKPIFKNIDQKTAIANSLRDWLSIPNKTYLEFAELKNRLEQKSLFIFLTSKYKGWSHIDRDFRGMAVVDETMPIIIINDSDSKKAQSFTLIHELGHILRDDMGIDGEQSDDSPTEKWCDQLAGEFLMPASSPLWNTLSSNKLSEIKKFAQQFKVSPHACLVRLKQLRKIDQGTYNDHEDALREEYQALQEKLKQTPGGPSRNRSKEVQEQFGNAFVRTVLTSWHNQEITLHKVAKLFDLKRPQQVIELDQNLKV